MFTSPFASFKILKTQATHWIATN